jgi:hypothetical protein
MNSRYVLAPEAARDLVQIWRHIKKESSSEMAEENKRRISHGFNGFDGLKSAESVESVANSSFAPRNRDSGKYRKEAAGISELYCYRSFTP